MKNIADTKKRIFGAVIDIIVLFIILIILGMLLGEVEIKGAVVSVRGIPAPITILVGLLYFVIMEAITGKTVGKYVAKTKVVNETGKKISWGQSIGRNLMRIIDSLFFYLVGFIAILISKNNQRLGDIVSKTYVVVDG